MKSKDFIEELKKADPSGEIHVSANGGAITFVEALPGYYDGPGVYIENDKFHIDGKNEKIVVHTEDEEDFIWDHDGDYSNIVVDVNNRSEEYIARFKKISDDYKRTQKRLLDEHTVQVLKKIQEGFQIYQHKNDKGKYWGVFYVEKGHEFKRNHDRDIYKDRSNHQDILCQGDVQALKESGFFEEVESNDCIYWRLKINSQS